MNARKCSKEGGGGGEEEEAVVEARAAAPTHEKRRNEDDLVTSMSIAKVATKLIVRLSKVCPKTSRKIST